MVNNSEIQCSIKKETTPWKYQTPLHPLYKSLFNVIF